MCVGKVEFTTSQTMEKVFLQGGRSFISDTKPAPSMGFSPRGNALGTFPQTVQPKRTAYKSPPAGDDLRPSLLHCFALMN